jgi:hypothetical protein
MSADRIARHGFAPGWLFFSFIAALALLKGIRMPNRWATTHYLFNYQTGFMKRSLWGEVLSRLLGGWTSKYFVLAAVALAIFVLLVSLLVVLCRRIPETPVRVPFLVVFLASPALTFAAHLSGYLEQIAYVCILFLVLQRRSWPLQVLSACAAAILLPAVHEAAVFWVGGLSALVVAAGPLARGRRLAWRAGACALLILLWTASTLAVINNGKVTKERAERVREDRTAFADIRPRQDAFQTLTVPLDSSLADMRQRWADRNMQVEAGYSALVFGPSLLFFAVLAFRRVRRIDSDRAGRIFAALLVVAAVAGPLCLHVVGWDTHRWNAMAAMNAGIAAAILLIATPAPADISAVQRPLASRLASAAFALCLWNIAADPTLFDEYGPAHPPFQYQIQFLREAIESRDPALWIPRPGN